jgi:membrane protein
MYGAFAVPVAVVLWINLMARLLLYCAAWTATVAGTAVRSGETAEGEGPEPGISPAAGGAPQRASAGSGAPAAPRLQKYGP